MKETPIFFTGEMVRAILEGRKTQTRRVIKPQPMYYQEGISNNSDKMVPLYIWNKSKNKNIYGELLDLLLYCPFGQPGDRLWVRETWSPRIGGSGFGRSGYIETIFYKADFQCGLFKGHNTDKINWKPSIHMPRWASRITLEIINIWVERLHDITAEECIQEGLLRSDLPTVEERADYDKWQFSQLWDSIYLVRGYGWAINPLVWRIEFKPINIEEVA